MDYHIQQDWAEECLDAADLLPLLRRVDAEYGKFGVDAELSEDDIWSSDEWMALSEAQRSYTRYYAPLRQRALKALGTLEWTPWSTRAQQLVREVVEQLRETEARVSRMRAKYTQPCIAVRWLGAYDHAGHSDDLLAAAEWELRKERPVAVAWATPLARVGQGRVGLLVSVGESAHVRAYHGDAWTWVDEDTGQVEHSRSTCYASGAGKQVQFELPRLLVREYDELVVSDPQYVGVVVASRVLEEATLEQEAQLLQSGQKVADAIGLPFLGESNSEATVPYRRPKSIEALGE